MSRLESFRRRLTAQIDGLNWAARQIDGLNGDVLELGLGNGRTYDHLRQELPERRIRVIDRVMNAHPASTPPASDFLLGEAEDMLGRLAGEGARMALAHYDFGFGVKEKDVAEGARLSPFIAALMVPGGLVVSQQPLVGFTQITGPDTIDPDRYLFYRA
ncbi:class I SAM-dependent methyltransferase [Sulfitobacter sp. S190]|uniref:class I SAM-dependent methyltransferase n=1 Tax=Sulfitobacter sp. S190 TaxID=2867022 RepID=UPI0021A2AD86|nr:class I SAM-dependent methyltransferase [Sulfitobacter sp. S190]UWR21966.1 class I SAM-dependent methyltransferase [Sulfitobacter sp. S190]